MWALRLLAGAAAVTFLLVAIRSYQRRNISRLSLFTAFIAAAAVVVLAAFPNLFDPVFDTFNFQPGDNRRLVALLLGAVVVLFLLLFRLQGHSDRSERAIRQLVESLTVERFDWEEAERRVPPGPKPRQGRGSPSATECIQSATGRAKAHGPNGWRPRWWALPV